MKLLLDTHVFLLDGFRPESPLVHCAVADHGCQQRAFSLSVVSLWEIAIKAALGKLTLRLSLKQLVDENRACERAVVFYTSCPITSMNLNSYLLCIVTHLTA